jgi:hypothetical protein
MCLSRTPPQSSGQLGNLIDHTVGYALAEMLGGIPIGKPNSRLLTPPMPNCVEVGPARIEGGIRHQNFDVAYRPTGFEPEGVRFAFDSKTLNDTKSVMKNWQNMVNDIATKLLRFIVSILMRSSASLSPSRCLALVKLGGIRW